MQVLGTAKGVTYIDDCASCNVEAAVAALKSVQQPTVLMIGGSAHHQPDGSLGLQMLAPLLEGHR